ncbi:hypothetical protein T069G_06627 [Trichoderma breve]|uniref:2EXR domain-containing protein n=1 Tax=Trichoderma breve TaxID=2034170 RepID=A0A9W9BDH8_9HYPO|nr:hypothetical protein T069G_06627 [Trichoderma breve]KAJ4858360.1 hypothetical protein T069G_06627 [Trichoderma breve]
MRIRIPGTRSRASSPPPRRTRSPGIPIFGLLNFIASHKPTKQQPDTFHPFSRLPTELRLKIWQLSLPSPRLVSVQCGVDISAFARPPPDSPEYTGCTSPTRIPVSLQVCTESRAEALKSYQPSLGFFRGDGLVYFNYDIDILYFGPREGFMAADSQFHTCMMLCEPSELARVRRLAVNEALFRLVGDTYEFMSATRFTLEMLRQVSQRMKGLEELILVPWDEEMVEESLVRERLTKQMESALQSMKTEVDPSWRAPPWKIIPLKELPSMID